MLTDLSTGRTGRSLAGTIIENNSPGKVQTALIISFFHIFCKITIKNPTFALVHLNVYDYNNTITSKKVMKKIFFLITSLVMATSIASAQDINSITDIYNMGAQQLESGNKEVALGHFEDALMQADMLGEEGYEIADNCKIIIPSLMISIAKDLIKENQMDAAIGQLEIAAEKATEYGSFSDEQTASALIKQALMVKGTNLFNSKDYAGAIEAYNSILTKDPKNGMAAINLGKAYEANNMIDDAERSYLLAADNGQKTNAYKNLSNLFVKQSAAVLKTKNYEEAIAYALKSNQYIENATAMKVAGTAAVSLKKNSDAITYLQKYLQLSPTAKDANDIKYTIGTLAQSIGDKAVAIEYYKMLLNDPKYGPSAKQLIENLSK